MESLCEVTGLLPAEGFPLALTKMTSSSLSRQRGRALRKTAMEQDPGNKCAEHTFLARLIFSSVAFQRGFQTCARRRGSRWLRWDGN